MIHLRTLNDLITTLRSLMRDELEERWTDAEMEGILLLALDEWSGRVSCEAVYSLADGWSADTLRYALPEYIDPTRCTPQFQGPVDEWMQISWQAQGDRRWHTFGNWQIVNGEIELGERVTAPGRIVFWVAPHCTRTTSTVDGAHTATVTTITLDTMPDDAPLAGWVQIGNEWCSYAGIDWDALQLQNVGRAVKGTAGTISGGATVAWGICAPTPQLWNQLMNSARCRLHEMFLTDASARETSTHERMIQFYRSRADMFWRGWTPQRNPRMKIETRQGE